jgi:dipeptidyl aminopeptidase/acylaminoacyl peptidase
MHSPFHRSMLPSLRGQLASREGAGLLPVPTPPSKRKVEKMMIKNLNRLGVMLPVAAGTLVAGGLLLLMLLVAVEPAGAALPGQNGRIAFSSTRGDVASTDACPEFPTSSPCHHEIYTMNSNGTDSVRLTNNTASDSDPAWSPDIAGPIPGANQIAFSSDRDGNRGDIYTMNPFLSIEGPNGLLIVPTDRLTDSSAWDLQPAWSPDGNKIAFTSNRDGQHSPTGECVSPTFCNWNIYSMTQDGTGLVQLTTNTGHDSQPAWSPDGNKIAFVSDRSGASVIYTMNSNGAGEPVPLTNNPLGDIAPD